MKLPLSSNAAVVDVAVTVSSAAGGAGAAIANTTKTMSVQLHNTGLQPVEFQVDAGAWVPLPDHSDTTLDVDLSAQTIKLRKGADATANGTVTARLSSLDAGYQAGDEAFMAVATGVPVNSQTGTAYTLVAADAGKQIDMSNAAPNTCSIPTHSVVPFPVGTVVYVCMAGAGATTIAGAGVTLQKPSAKSLTISAQYEKASLLKVADNTWRVNAT